MGVIFMREMSARQDEPCAHLTSSIASMQASLKNKSPISSLSLPALPSGCRSCKRGPLRLTRLLPTFGNTLPPYNPHQCPLSRPELQVLSGPCQSPQGQQSLCLTGGRPRGEGAPGEKQRTTFFLPSQSAPEAWHQLNDEFQRSAVLVGFPVGQNEDAVKMFWDESFPNAHPAFDIMCKKVSDTHVSFFQTRRLSSKSLTLTLVWISGTLPTALWQCGNLQTCLSTIRWWSDGEAFGSSLECGQQARHQALTVHTRDPSYTGLRLEQPKSMYRWQSLPVLDAHLLSSCWNVVPMFFKVHEEAELPGVTFQDLEDILVSVRASSWDIVIWFLLSFSFHVGGGFVSRRQVCYSVSPGAGHSSVGDHSQACAPDCQFLQDFAELCVDVPFVTWPILAPRLGGCTHCPEDCELPEHGGIEHLMNIAVVLDRNAWLKFCFLVEVFLVLMRFLNMRIFFWRRDHLVRIRERDRSCRKQHREIAHLFSFLAQSCSQRFVLVARCSTEWGPYDCGGAHLLSRCQDWFWHYCSTAVERITKSQSTAGRASFDTEARDLERGPQESASGQTTRADVKLRETLQVDRLLAGYFEHGKETLVMRIPDGPSADSRAQAAAAGAWSGGLPRWWQWHLNSTSTSGPSSAIGTKWSAGDWHPLMGKFHDFLTAMTSAEACKQLGVDGVVVEEVRALSWPTILWLWCEWEAGRPRPEAWREVMLVAIPKKTDKVGFRAMRYISLLPVLQNCYVRALQVAVRRERGDSMRQTSCVFELQRFTANVTGTLRQVLSKAAEWGVGANVASADVEGAFDGIRHEDVTQALLQKGVHPGTVCSFLREPFDLQGRISLPGAHCFSWFSVCSGHSPGQCGGPDLCNQVLDNALREPASRWETEESAFNGLPQSADEETWPIQWCCG